MSDRHRTSVIALRRYRAQRSKATQRLVVGTLISALAGSIFAPSSVAPLTDAALVHWGGWPLETAFALSLVLGAVTVFGSLEHLFRAPGVELLRSLPLTGKSWARDRTLAVMRNGALLALPVAAFVFSGAASRGEPVLGALAAGYALAMGLAAALSGFTASVEAGTLETAAAGGMRKMMSSPVGQSTGGSFHIIPGLGFAAFGAFALITKLGVEEPLRVWYSDAAFELTRAAQVAIGVPAAALALATARAIRALAERAHEMVARFDEAEQATVDVEYAYFSEGRRPSSGIERRLEPSVALLARALMEQLRRKHAFARVGLVLATAGIALVGWSYGQSVSPAAFGGLASAWLIMMSFAPRLLHRLSSEAPYGASSWLCDLSQRQKAWDVVTDFRLVREALILSFGAVPLPGLQARAAYLALLWSSAAALSFAKRQSLTEDITLRVGFALTCGALLLAGLTLIGPMGVFVALGLAVCALGASVTQTFATTRQT